MAHGLQSEVNGGWSRFGIQRGSPAAVPASLTSSTSGSGVTFPAAVPSPREGAFVHRCATPADDTIIKLPEKAVYRTQYSAAPRAQHGGRSPSPAVDASLCALRSFYADVLGGAEVSPDGCSRTDDVLRFLIEEQLVEVHASVNDSPETLELTVASPIDVAERCWDAGYTVALEGEGADARFFVNDPVDRLITLLPSRREVAA